MAERVPLPHHEPRPDVDLLDQRVAEHAIPLAPGRREVQVDRLVGVDPSRALGSDANRVQVCLQAVAGTNRGHRSVGGVVDHVFALPESEFEDAPLPPHERRRAAVLLDAEVGGPLAARQRMEPHQASVLRHDHRPGRPLALVGGQEQLPGARAEPGGGDDLDRRRRERRSGAVALDGGRVAAVGRPLFLGDGRELGDSERAAGVPRRSRAGAGPGGHRDLLARHEWRRRHEALARARRVRAQDPRVHAAARAHHANVGDPRAGTAEEADLGLRRGVGRAGQG